MTVVLLMHFSENLQYERDTNMYLTLFEVGGVFNTPYRKSALRPLKCPPNTPKFRDFSYFYMTHLKSKKKYFGFSQ